MDTVPVRRVEDPRWLSTQIDLAARRFRCDDRRVVGVLWWYSASMLLLGPMVAGRDPATIVLHVRADGLIHSATAAGVGADYRDALAAPIASVAAVTGAAERTLWAIATDSLANQALWTGVGPDGAAAFAASVGPELPAPRFTSVAGRPVVRRASCCLVYLTPDADKCVSCPRQTPAERDQRLRNSLGG